MTWLALGIAVVTGVVAVICTTTDGALLSSDTDRQFGGLSRERAHRSLSTARALALFTAGCSATVALRGLLGDGNSTVIVIVAIATVLVLFADSIARSSGDALDAAALQRLQPLIRAVAVVVWPATELSARADAMLLRVFPPPPDDEEHDLTQEQFREVVAAEVQVTPGEAIMLHGVFSLQDTEVQEVMIPRVDIVGIDRETPWSEVVARVRSAEHARFPVYNETLDDIVGIIYAKDLLYAVIADQEPTDGWTSLVRGAEFIPGTKTADVQLRDFKSSRTHIAIVVDEYGGTAGLVTIEDVLEEIVGEIRDEHDEEEREVEQVDGRRFWVSGRLSLEELSELLDEDLVRDDVTTVGGLIYEVLGRVPRAGEELTIGGYRVVVERVRRRRIERVFFERAESLVAGGAEE